MRKSNKKFQIAIASAALLMFAMVGGAAGDVKAAQLFGPADKQQLTVDVPSSTQARNMYVWGKTVIVGANSAKDLVAAGSEVHVNGNTADDLIVVGGNVTVNGTVGGTIRVAGGNVNILGGVREDVVVAGGTVYVGSQAQISGDVLAAGGAVNLQGPVTGNVTIDGGKVEINNSVGGAVKVKTKMLTLGSKANIAGNVDYTSQNVYQRDANAKVTGQVTYHELGKAERGGRHSGWALVWAIIFGTAFKYVAALIVAYLLFYMYQAWFVDHVAITSDRKFWKLFAYGLVAFIVAPLAALVLFFTLVGYYAAIIVLMVWALAMMLACLMGTVAFGHWISELVVRRKIAIGYGSIALVLAIGVILESIPVVGLIAMAIVSLASLGLMVTTLKRRKV